MRQLVRTVLALAALIFSVALVFRFQTITFVITGLAVMQPAWAVLVAILRQWLKGRRSKVRANTPEQANAAADFLAEETVARWRDEAAARRITAPGSAPVRWRWGPDALTISRGEAAVTPPPGTGPAPLPRPRCRPGKIPSSGEVTQLYGEVYARLPYGRLVLTGGPGSGKTAAMILLLLAALEQRAAQHDAASRLSIPVPVWLTLSGWNPEAESLAEWATDTLNRDYPNLASEYGANTAEYLIEHGRVALFLDGLDEMPDGLRAAALEQLNTGSRELRAVLTARPVEYKLALHDMNLDYCVVVELCPIRVKDAAEYLLQGRSSESRRLWEPVTRYLRSNPNSVTSQTLNNPLYLSMARDAYATADPAPLIDPVRFPTIEALSYHLIDQFLVTAYPDKKSRAHAIQWLAWIAKNLRTGKDLRWWDIPHWVPGWHLRAARGLLAGIATWPVVTLLAWLTYRTGGQTAGQPPGIAIWAAPGIAAGLGAAILAGLVIKVEGGPSPVARQSIWKRLRGLLPWPGAVIASFIAGTIADALASGTTSRPPIATAYTEVGVFFVAMLVWAFFLSRRSGTVPLLERPNVRVITGTLAAACPAALWAYLVNGPKSVLFAVFIASVYALAFGSILAGLWRGAHGGRRSGPWAIPTQRPRTTWLAALWLVVVPLVFPRIVSGWVTAAAGIPSATPASTYRTDRRASAFYAGGYAAMLAIPSLVVIAVLIVAANHPPVVTRAVLITGWVAAAVLITWFISWICAGQVTLVLLTQLALYPSLGRVSFAHLLRDAHKRQVLRQAGAIYQFRHVDLQARLANRAE